MEDNSDIVCKLKVSVQQYLLNTAALMIIYDLFYFILMIINDLVIIWGGFF